MKDLIKIQKKGMLVILFLINVIEACLSYGLSYLLRYVSSSLTLSSLEILAVGIISIEMMLALIRGVKQYIDSTTYVKMGNKIQEYYLDKVVHMTASSFSESHTGVLQRLLSDIAYYGPEYISEFCEAPIPLVIGSVILVTSMSTLSLTFGFITILIAGVAVCVKYALYCYNKEATEKDSQAYASYNATLVDFIQNIVTVRRLHIHDFCKEKIMEKQDSALEASKKSYRGFSISNTLFQMIFSLEYVVVFLFIGQAMSRGENGVSYILFYVSALSPFYGALNATVRLLDTRRRAIVSKKQLDHIFHDNKEVKTIKNYHEISMHNVTFHYPGYEETIMIPDFSIKTHDKICITGESGQGKTTLVNMIAGLYTPTQGYIEIDDKPVSEKEQPDVVYISQETDLFDMSIRDNLCLGKIIPDDILIHYINEAGLGAWFKKLPDGLDTITGERGIKLSTGQKQRLNLIRGILINKEVYILDEPTSNLDNDSTKKIIHMIQTHMKNKTYLIITHDKTLKSLCEKNYMFLGHKLKEEL